MSNLKLLKQLVNQNSFTQNLRGVNACQEIIKIYLEKNPFLWVKILQKNNRPNLLVAGNQKSKAGWEENIDVLLSGHIDTVHPVGATEVHYHRNGDTISGDGTIDMKGGIFVMANVLQKVASIPISVVTVFNIDEETGSKTYQRELDSIYKASKIILVFEGGNTKSRTSSDIEMSKTIVTHRGGYASYILETKGSNGHSGFVAKHHQRKNAIHAIAKQIHEISRLCNYKKKSLVNVGTIQGGTVVNVIPDYAQAELEFRIKYLDEMKRISQKLHTIVAKTHVPGTSSKLKEKLFIEPMRESTESEKYLYLLKKVASNLKIKISKEFRSSGSDGNHARRANPKAVIFDGLGPFGDYGHTKEEWISLKSINQSIFLTTQFINSLEHYEIS